MIDTELIETERRLRDALGAQAAAVTIKTRHWVEVRPEAYGARPRRLRLVTLTAVVAFAAAAALVAVFVAQPVHRPSEVNPGTKLTAPTLKRTPDRKPPKVKAGHHPMESRTTTPTTTPSTTAPATSMSSPPNSGTPINSTPIAAHAGDFATWNRGESVLELESANTGKVIRKLAARPTGTSTTGPAPEVAGGDAWVVLTKPVPGEPDGGAYLMWVPLRGGTFHKASNQLPSGQVVSFSMASNGDRWAVVIRAADELVVIGKTATKQIMRTYVQNNPIGTAALLGWEPHQDVDLYYDDGSRLLVLDIHDYGKSDAIRGETLANNSAFPWQDGYLNGNYFNGNVLVSPEANTSAKSWLLRATDIDYGLARPVTKLPVVRVPAAKGFTLGYVSVTTTGWFVGRFDKGGCVTPAIIAFDAGSAEVVLQRGGRPMTCSS